MNVCPACGGELQATVSVYLSCDPDEGWFVQMTPDTAGVHLYCENDCELDGHEETWQHAVTAAELLPTAYGVKGFPVYDAAEVKK